MNKQHGTRPQITGLGEHPIAQRGWAWLHVYILFEKIGYGPHPCHWGCGRLLAWRRGGSGIQVDHLDNDIWNNSPDNLVPSCIKCNTRRSSTYQDHITTGIMNMSDDARERRRIGGQRGGLANRGKPKKKIYCEKCGNSYSPHWIKRHRCSH